MIKRLISILLAVFSVFLFGCSDETVIDNTETARDLNAYAEAVNKESRVDGEYFLSITFGEGAVLYHADGDIAWDIGTKTAYAEFGQTYLGDSSVMKNYISGGKVISVDDGEKSESTRDETELFAKFPYAKILLHDEKCGNISISESAIGTAYEFTRTDTKEIFSRLIGEDIFDLVFSIKNPQRDKTQYKDTKCVYTVKDGKIVSCRYEFDVKLFDTPAYIPNYEQPEEEYTIDLHISAKITYNSFGDGVVIKEYTEESSDSSEESL